MRICITYLFKTLPVKRSALFVLLFFPVFLYAQNIDIDLLRCINPRNPSSVYWRVTSGSAYFLPAGTAAGTLLYGIIKKDRQARQNAYELVINVGVSVMITQIAKYTINRERPAERYPDEVFPTNKGYRHSFPSGHTSLAFSSATTIALQYKKWYITVPAYAWAASVGYSRMYRGMHYPSDVLVGAVAGTGCAFLSHWLTQKIIFPKKH